MRAAGKQQSQPEVDEIRSAREAQDLERRPRGHDQRGDTADRRRGPHQVAAQHADGNQHRGPAAAQNRRLDDQHHRRARDRDDHARQRQECDEMREHAAKYRSCSGRWTSASSPTCPGSAAHGKARRAATSERAWAGRTAKGGHLERDAALWTCRRESACAGNNARGGALKMHLNSGPRTSHSTSSPRRVRRKSRIAPLSAISAGEARRVSGYWGSRRGGRGQAASSSATSASTRVAICSRVSRTSSRGRPAGSGRSQSM